jgi:UDP:flavonoid glycosyltransferase YjiC (YdhE family)
MRIAVTSIGSEGDVRPYVALTKGLARAGHDAYLVAARRYRQRAEAPEFRSANRDSRGTKTSIGW